ncbi:hypothetical protein D3273_20035 [Lichenibacterium minor]|uniref:Uncharacterized protein n=1 Tax=Lichenibacterium minor TaxID=2316528 RepID=A0A4Q2U345_9HYPH|nr:hypothetical protein [Lichenibacterium minor]RYC30168.1 hypothetical protein D3273_20035 [Lichenibacterium minor]
MTSTDIKPNGFLLPNGCRITHGSGATIKTPFSTIPLTMHELYPGGTLPYPSTQRGQLGFIPFDHKLRLPRHVHVTMAERDEDRRLLAERILVTGGVGLVELNGRVYVIPHGTLVDIPEGVPHTWTACPPGVALPDGTETTGRFLMVYDYAEPTSFFPIQGTTTLKSMADYIRYDGPLEAICFPELTPERVRDEASFVWNDHLEGAGADRG